MTEHVTISRTRAQRRKEAVERALMLVVLGLDPGASYTDYELHATWRRRMTQVNPESGGNGVTAAAINAAYVALVDSAGHYKPIDLRL